MAIVSTAIFVFFRSKTKSGLKQRIESSGYMLAMWAADSVLHLFVWGIDRINFINFESVNALLTNALKISQ